MVEYNVRLLGELASIFNNFEVENKESEFREWKKGRPLAINFSAAKFTDDYFSARYPAVPYHACVE